jgi:hypothetical protein
VREIAAPEPALLEGGDERVVVKKKARRIARGLVSQVTPR